VHPRVVDTEEFVVMDSEHPAADTEGFGDMGNSGDMGNPEGSEQTAAGTAGIEIEDSADIEGTAGIEDLEDSADSADIADTADIVDIEDSADIAGIEDLADTAGTADFGTGVEDTRRSAVLFSCGRFAVSAQLLLQ